MGDWGKVMAWQWDKADVVYETAGVRTAEGFRAAVPTELRPGIIHWAPMGTWGGGVRLIVSGSA